jgi:hypothetical protein
MKTKMKSLLAACALGLLGLSATQASATTYAPDTLLGSADLSSSGDAAELAAMCAAAFGANPCNLTLDLKLDAGDSAFNVTSNGAGSWFIDVAPTTPGYFLLKFGTGDLPSGTHNTFFFQNIADFTKLVFTDAQVNFLTGGCPTSTGPGKPPPTCNIGRLSHYATFDGSEIPVPAALPLLLSGLAGLGFLARRRAKKA